MLEKGSSVGLGEGTQQVPLLSLLLTQLLPAFFFFTHWLALLLRNWLKMALLKALGHCLLKGPAQIKTGHS